MLAVGCFYAKVQTTAAVTTTASNLNFLAVIGVPKTTQMNAIRQIAFKCISLTASRTASPSGAG